MSSFHLPDDIIALQILVKVPCVKFVLRCTSVCKSWYSFIKSPLFINLHLYGPKNIKYLLCDYISAICYKERYLSIQHDIEAFVEHYRLVFPGKLRYEIIIHGCCNGLVCYTKHKDSRGYVYLWNPTIRKLKVLPKYRNYKDSPIRLGFGFWFDKQANDYMVAKISYTDETSSVDLYSLSSNSWKIIGQSIPGMPVTRRFELVHVEGTLHWPAKRNRRYMINSLDIKTGMFRETLISWGSDKKVSDIYLTAIGEHSLAVFGSEIVKGSYDDTYRCLIVLVYDHNLNKLHKIDLEKETCHVLQRVVGLRNNGEALFPKLKCNDSGMVSCNVETKDFVEFVSELDYDMRVITKEIKGSSSYYKYYDRKLRRVRPFVETLVLLNDEDAKNISTPSYEATYFKTN